MDEKKEQLSPMLAHWRSVKDSLPDCLIFYRAGDFYELFFEDALEASRLLDLVLTGKNAGLSEKAPMCGVPHKSVNVYIQKLVQLGRKVAIVEQMEDPKTTKGMVKRDVIRVVTPGTFVDVEDDKTTITIAALCDGGLHYLLSVVDMASGEVYGYTIEHQLAALLARLKSQNVMELVVEHGFNQDLLQDIQKNGIAVSYCDTQGIDASYASIVSQVSDQFLKRSFSILVNYLQATQKQMLNHLQPMQLVDETKICKLDYGSLTNLELTQSLHHGSTMANLWHYLDHCQSALGSRMLKQWIENPLRDKQAILKRQNQVTYLIQDALIRSDLKEALAGVYDLTRLSARIAMNRANAIDLLRLSKTLMVLPSIKHALADDIFDNLNHFDCFESLAQLLQDAIVDNPPVSTKEGGMFKPGYNEQLDQYHDAADHHKEWLIEYEKEQKELTGIKNLRVVYSRNFGYCLEVSKGNLGLIKEEYGYIRRQTLTNVERFTTVALKEHEDLLINGQTRAIQLESDLFDALIQSISNYVPQFYRIANCLGAIDCIYALSETSASKGFVAPTFGDGLTIVNGKHPLLDQWLNHASIANDATLDPNHPILLITGPNMGGKSTYMRMIAINAILAQIGCYVAASQATFPIYDAIYTRIGASDDLFNGQSTFMMEMMEANHALSHATKDSLIIFDEIGRGTSTYDGMALAQAMIEYIASSIHCHTLFSTHYHELTQLSATLDGIANVHACVVEHDSTIEFTYRIEKGKADKSYGIHVARLAHLPSVVLNRANVLVQQIETNPTMVQPSLFDEIQPISIESKTSEVEVALDSIDPDTLTPLSALQLVYQLKALMDKNQ